jgi:hypothetical protein
MAIVQDTYNAAPAVGYPGMVANGETSNRLSRTVEDAGGIGFGKATFRGAGDHGITATPATGNFMGVTIADHGLALVPGGTADVVPQGREVGLLNEGSIWVLAGSNTTDGADAYVTSGGAFTTTSSGNTAIPAKFDDTVSSGAPVRLRVVR